MAVGDLKIVPDNHQHPFPPDLRFVRESLNERDVINSAIRWIGMLVYVIEEEKWYYLKGGLTNEFWVEIGSGGDSVANAVQYIVQTLTQEQQAQARENIGAAAILDGIISLGAVTSTANDVTIASAVWRINGVNYGQGDPTVISIPVPTAGTTRRDIIVGNTSAGIVLVQGVEAPSGEVAITPDVPANTILLVETLSNDAGLDQVIEAALESYVRFDIGTQGLSPSQRKNARDNIQTISKDTNDTRVGTLTQTGLLTLLTGENGSASSYIFLTQNTKGGGVRVQKRGSMTVRANGDSTTDYHIIRGEDVAGDMVFEVRAGGVTSGGDPVNNNDFVTLGYMLSSISGSTTNFSEDNFYSAPQTIGAEEEQVIFTKTDKDIVYEDGGVQIVYPDMMANLIFTGPAVELRGIGYAYDGNEITIENKTNENLIVTDNYISAPANTEFNLGGTNLTVLPNTKVAFKASNDQWVQSLNISTSTFSDTLNSLHAVRSIGSDGLEVISNIQDKNTGEDVVFKELTSTPAIVDGVVYAEVDGKYFKRDTPFGVNVKWFAKGDGVTDDTAAIQSAVQYPNVFFPHVAANYRTTDTVNVPSTVKILRMDSPISIDTPDIEALVIGVSGQTIVSANLKIQVTRASQSDWLSEASIGVKIINANTCQINLVNTTRNTVGARFIGDAGGFSYNEVTLGFIRDNKIGVDLNSDSTVSIGWCNENKFYGGRFTQLSGTNPGLDRIGARIKSLDGTYTKNNNNIFSKPSFELMEATANPGLATPIVIEHGNSNQFQSIRNESNSSITAYIWNSSTENIVTSGFGEINIQDNSEYPYTLSSSIRSRLTDEAKNIIFNSGPIHKKACYYNGSTAVYIPGLSVSISTGDGFFLTDSGSSLEINEDYYQVGGARALGVFVDTSEEKRFVVRRDTESGFGGRVNIRCYDDAGILLGSAGANHPYVKGTSYNTISFNSAYGGVYRTNSDANSDLYFSLHSDVKYIYLAVVGGTAALRIRSFSIASVDGGSPAVWSGQEQYGTRNIGTTPPTVGTWEKGFRIYNDSLPLAEGAPEGWVCTVTGTPGTWEEFGEAAIPPDNSFFRNIEMLADNAGTTFDLNALTDGFVKFNTISTNTFVNAPYSGWWMVQDIKGENRETHTQIAWGVATNKIYYRTYYNSWAPWILVGGTKPDLENDVASSNLPSGSINYYNRYTGGSGTVTINADLFTAGDVVEGEIEVGNKTFVGGAGVTLRYAGSNIVQANQKFSIKFKTANDALLEIHSGKAASSADTATAVGASYSQTEVQAILDELRDLKTKMRTAGLLDA